MGKPVRYAFISCTFQTVQYKRHCHVCIFLCTGLNVIGNVSFNGDTGWPNWLKTQNSC